MLRRRIFPVAAAAAAAAFVIGGCSPAVKEAYFRSVELAPASEAGFETVADLQVVGTKKVIGTAKGQVGTVEREQDLHVQALEAALASDASGPDVLVAPSYFEVRSGRDSMTVTVVGYPARYRNFRRNVVVARNKAPFTVKALPGGAAVVSYDKSAFTAKSVNDNMIVVQPIQSVNQAPSSAVGASESGAPSATSTEDQTGE